MGVRHNADALSRMSLLFLGFQLLPPGFGPTFLRIALEAASWADVDLERCEMSHEFASERGGLCRRSLRDAAPVARAGFCPAGEAQVAW